MTDLADRLPPGQYQARGWPTLHFGAVPAVGPEGWSFRVRGAVEQPLTWSWEEFTDLPTVDVRADFHCVTKFSVLDNDWHGVAARTVLDAARPAAGASHALLHAAEGYTANLPLDVLQEGDVLFAWRRNGEDLTPDHGWPMRLVVPSRYAWKSVKWVTGMEVLVGDRRGFWEERGYHNDADPWREQRYSYQE